MLALSLENVLADVDVLVDMGTTSLVTLLLVLSCCIALSISSQLDSVKQTLLLDLGTQTRTSAQAKAKVTEEQKLAYKQKADAMVIEMLEYTSPKTAVPGGRLAQSTVPRRFRPRCRALTSCASRA